MGFMDSLKDQAQGKVAELTSKLLSNLPDMDSLSGAGRQNAADDAVASVYPDSRFRGEPTPLKVGRYTFADFRCGNDAVSSVRVRSGYKVVLFEHVDFKGKMRELTEDTPHLGSFNDLCSSAIVEKL